MSHNHVVTLGRILRRLRAELRFTGFAAWRALVELVNSSDLTHAAAIAYYALLSFFPFLLLIISLLGSITASDENRYAVLTFVFRYFPTQLDFVSNQLVAFRETRVEVGVAGALALIWASLGVFGAVTNAVNEAWGVEKQRSFLKHRMVSFLMLVLRPMYHAKPSKARRQRTPVMMAPTQTSRKRVFAFGMK